MGRGMLFAATGGLVVGSHVRAARNSWEAWSEGRGPATVTVAGAAEGRRRREAVEVVLR